MHPSGRLNSWHQTHPAFTTAEGFAEDEVGNDNWLVCPWGIRVALGFTTTHGGHGGPTSTKNQVLHPQVLQICVLCRAAMGRSTPETAPYCIMEKTSFGLQIQASPSPSAHKKSFALER